MTNTSFRPTRSQRSTASISRNGAASSAWRERSDGDDRDRRPRACRSPSHRRSSSSDPGPAPKRIVDRLRLLDLPAHRHRDVLLLLRGLRGAVRARPPAARAGREMFEQRNVAIETVCLLLSSFTCGMASIARRRAQPALVLSRHGRDLRARRCLPRHRVPRVRRPGRARLRPVAQRVSVVRSSRWSAATACTSPPACCGCSP